MNSIAYAKLALRNTNSWSYLGVKARVVDERKISGMNAIHTNLSVSNIRSSQTSSPQQTTSEKFLSKSFRNYSIDTHLSSLEKTLNVFGYIPFISTLSGTIRSLYGIAELAAGIAIALFQSSQYLFHCNQENRNKALAGLRYICHGYANIIRGSIEALPGTLVVMNIAKESFHNYILNYNFLLKFPFITLALSCIGNLSNLFYDKGLHLRMSYASEQITSG